MAKDPVCGMEIDEKKAVFSAKYKGGLFISAPRVARLLLKKSRRNTRLKKGASPTPVADCTGAEQWKNKR